MTDVRALFCIFIGGGLGSLGRYGLSVWVNRLTGGAFPWATMGVNVLGCLLIGMFGGCAAHFGWGREVRLLLTVGLCGGFTTFSTFSNEALLLLRSGHYVWFALYAAGSLLLGLFGVWLGLRLADCLH